MVGCRPVALSAAVAQQLPRQVVPHGVLRRPTGPLRRDPSTVLRAGNHTLLPWRTAAAARDGAASSSWWTKECPPNMRDVYTVQQLVDELAAAGDRLVIVDFYATWCNACKALFPKLRKISETNTDIIILKVNWEDAKTICKTMGIKVLPYFHFYRGADGKLAAFSASVSKIQRLRDAIMEHGSSRCALGEHEGPWLPEFPEVTPSFDSVDFAADVPWQGIPEGQHLVQTLRPKGSGTRQLAPQQLPGSRGHQQQLAAMH